MGGEDVDQADNQVRRSAEMADSSDDGYGVIAEGGVARSACRAASDLRRLRHPLRAHAVGNRFGQMDAADG
ncbi:hypothetical protein, partial [Mesorhizobium ciceri]|uniref:hypothetical protein n=1 Tax=Mesorhizobium ciceri TaxID=39645 RepID=UPI00344C7AAB